MSRLLSNNAPVGVLGLVFVISRLLVDGEVANRVLFEVCTMFGLSDNGLFLLNLEVGVALPSCLSSRPMIAPAFNS